MIWDPIIPIMYTEDRAGNGEWSGRPDLCLRRSKEDDSGYDLPLWLPDGFFVIPAHGVKDLRTGLRLCLPREYGALIKARSSAFKHHGLRVHEGLIDSGYTGELRVLAVNTTGSPVKVTDGQRIAQVVFFPVVRPSFAVVTVFPETERGTDGFGSTGH